jgi:2-polyprenyl-6-methoxyphenol hydroxylase-like FAD-dependent oxidoreductase
MVHKCFGDDNVDSVLGDNYYRWTKKSKRRDCMSIALSEVVDGVTIITTTYPISNEDACVIVECGAIEITENKNEALLASFDQRVGTAGLVPWKVYHGTKWIRPRLSRVRRMQRDNLAVIGDASCSFHFSSGVALFYALEAGRVLCASLALANEVRTALSLYERSMRDSLQKAQRRSVERMRWFERLARGCHSDLNQILREYASLGLGG